MNNPENQQPENYGGNGAEQTDIAQKSLRYQDRFNQNSEPKGHEGLGGAEAEKVRG